MSSTTLEPRTERPGAVRPPKKRRPPILPWTLLVPSLVGSPIVRLFVMSFQKYERAQLMGQPAEWVGFDNYAQVLTDVQGFWTVLLRSFVFMVVCVALEYPGESSHRPAHTSEDKDGDATANEDQLQ